MPTEAQLAYVSSGLEGRLYVWGNDEPACGDAVFAPGGRGPYAFSTPDHRRPTGTTGGPLTVTETQLTRDTLELKSGVIVGIASNVAELARDRWQRWDERCWESPLLRDPVCMKKSSVDGERWVLRGGGWASGPYALRAAARVGVRPPANESDTNWPRFGFRCAWQD